MQLIQLGAKFALGASLRKAAGSLFGQQKFALFIQKYQMRRHHPRPAARHMNDRRLIGIHRTPALEQRISQHRSERFAGQGIQSVGVQFLHCLLDFDLLHKPACLLVGLLQPSGLFARQVTKLFADA